MAQQKIMKGLATTLPFDKFWKWLQGHANCIVRAGTPEAVLFDDDDLHWHLSAENEDLLVQVMRGKRVVGELVLAPGDIAYVQVEPLEGEEFVFDCIQETESDRIAAYHFVMSHAYDETEDLPPGRFVH